VSLRHLLWAAPLVGLGCGGGGDVTNPPVTGSLTITTITSGPAPDADGYAVIINDGAETAIPASGTLQRDNVEPGNHSIQLTGMAANCTVAGDNPRSVSIPAGETVTVTFQLTCSATTGSLRITTATSGPTPDVDGYTLTLDGTERGILTGSAELTVDGIALGDHQIGLSGIAANCQAQGDNPMTVAVAAGATGTAAFVVSCVTPPSATGSLKITTTTSGSDPDPDGYGLVLDGGGNQTIGLNATATIANVTPGEHAVLLSGVAANCAVQGSNPRTVRVITGAIATVAFASTCTGVAAAVVVPLTATDQTGTAGNQLPTPITVRVASATGAPVGGIAVAFAIAEGGGTLSATAVSTRPDGTAAVTWTLGKRASLNRATVRVGSLPVLTFRATGEPGLPHHLVVVTEPVGARAGSPLETQPLIALADEHANPTGAGSVHVRAILEGPGELTGGTDIAAHGGQATFLNLGLRGSAGPRSIRFEADGLGGTTSQTFTLLPPQRSEVDRPDEASGSQFHVVYVLPADAVDRALDTGTELAYGIAAFQLWLSGQAGLRLRVDEYAGTPDVTFMRIQETDAQMAANDPYIVNVLETRLRQAGRLQPGKLYLIYYEGSSTYTCGGAHWPPQAPGPTAAMYLRGKGCPNSFVSSPTAFPMYWEFAMLHDALHLLGIVSPQAPHHTSGYPGHVPEPQDLMYSGPAPWQIGTNMRVDIDGDDYFGQGVPGGVVNLATSSFVESFVANGQVAQQAASPAELATLRAQLEALPPHPAFEVSAPRSRSRRLE
jgi:hypothetical protein